MNILVYCEAPMGQLRILVVVIGGFLVVFSGFLWFSSTFKWVLPKISK